MTQRLHERYKAEIVPALTKQFEYRNPMQVPRLSKIVVNIGLGEALTNAKAIDAATGDLSAITGQKPIVTKAKRSIAQFRLRAGNPVGAGRDPARPADVGLPRPADLARAAPHP